MRKVWNKIYNLFAKAPVNSDAMGSGEQLALLRMSGFAYALYILVIAIVLGLLNGINYAIPALVIFAMSIVLFCVSYFQTSLAYTSTVATLIVVFVSYLELYTDCKFGIGMAMLGIIPLIFSSIRFSTLTKIAFGVVITAVHLVIDFINTMGFIKFNAPTKGALIMSEITQVFFAIIVMMVSYYFCRQFTQAEHQVYVINRQLKKMASLDPLTGLMNRRGMSDVLPDMEDGYKNGTSGLSIAIGDIDFFKKVNDTYGHDCGDYVLKTVSAYFAKYMDGKGEICRWGGEEFLFAFSDKNADDVFVMLNDMRHAIKHMQFEFNDIKFNVTMTFGLEEYTPYAQLDSTIKKADEKLYLGKESGRDKVVY